MSKRSKRRNKKHNMAKSRLQVENAAATTDEMVDEVPETEPQVKTHGEMDRSSVDTNDGLTHFYFAPNGASHGIQARITQLMHLIAKANGNHTLGEMGYLHMNTVTFADNKLSIKVYFDVDLATKVIKDSIGRKHRTPNPALEIFKNYLFIGDLGAACDLDDIAVPKRKIDVNAMGTDYLRITKTNKLEEDTPVLVLNCNPSLVFAAANNISLKDPNYRYDFTTIGSVDTKKNKDKIDRNVYYGESEPVEEDFENTHILTCSNSHQDLPIYLHVTFSTDYGQKVGYSPDDAVPYLLDKYERSKNAATAKRKLMNKVSDDAKSITKERSKQRYKKFSKFR